MSTRTMSSLFSAARVSATMRAGASGKPVVCTPAVELTGEQFADPLLTDVEGG